MRLFLLSVGLWLCFAVLASAQPAPKAEVFGGYSYFRADGQGEKGANLNGWSGSLAGNLNNWLGVVADVSGHYGNDKIDVTYIQPGPPLKADVSIHNFLFGPRFTYRKHERIAPFAHSLFGVSRAKASALGLEVKENAFAVALGGGVDVKLSERFAFRVIQADYVLTRFREDLTVPNSPHNTQNHARISTGIVFRFGKK